MRHPAALLGAVLSLLAPESMRAQSAPSDSTIRAILQARVDSGRTVGIVVGITQNGTRRFFTAGTAGPGRAPLDEHTIFEIGSISKTFNALLLADAVTRGEVRLDQPVAELLPSTVKLPTHPSGPITLEHLATHRSGLPRLPGNMMPADGNDPYADYDTTRLHAFLASHTLTRAPGAIGEYSNLGAGLLGYALTVRAGKPSWGALVDERITGPLAMRETHVEVPAALRARFAAAHNAAMDTVSYWRLDALAGAGALRSTAADMLTYLEAQLQPAATPLPRAIPMSQDVRHAFGGVDSIALGWLVRTRPSSRIYWHNGGTGGFRSFAGFDPLRGIGVVVLVNAKVPPEDIGMHLLDPRLPLAMPPVPPRRTAIEVSAEVLERLVGKYALTSQITLTVTREGDALYVQPSGQPKFRLWASARDRFFLREVDAQLEFEFDAAGQATAVTLVQHGARRRAVRRAEMSSLAPVRAQRFTRSPDTSARAIRLVQDDSARGWRIPVVGIAIGAVAGAALGAVYAEGQCEGTEPCGEWKTGAKGGALIGGAIGLVMELIGPSPG
ncbi:MAG TPA: serine hydrolase [Gemmatimonadaceae bacterium]|nr:serine hydrolase [Gemmatimonadaceae bacterium]